MTSDLSKPTNIDQMVLALLIAGGHVSETKVREAFSIAESTLDTEAKRIHALNIHGWAVHVKWEDLLDGTRDLYYRRALANLNSKGQNEDLQLAG